MRNGCIGQIDQHQHGLSLADAQDAVQAAGQGGKHVHVADPQRRVLIAGMDQGLVPGQQRVRVC